MLFFKCGLILSNGLGSGIEVVVTVLIVLSCSMILPLCHILEAHTVTFTRGRLIVAFSGPIPMTFAVKIKLCQHFKQLLIE